MKSGDKVQTTPAFSKLFDGGAKWTGVLLSSKELDKRTVWLVRVDGISAPQVVSEKFLKVVKS